MATRKPAGKKTAAAKKPAASKRAPAKTSKPKPKAKAKAKKPAPQKPVSTAAKLLAAPAVPDPSTTDADGLTPSMRLFVAEYTIDRNATRAYLVAFPDVKRSTAAVEGCKLLKNPKVRAAIDRAFDETLAKLGTSREEVIGRLVAIATADANEIMELRLGACESCWGGSTENKLPNFWKAEPDPDCTGCGGEGFPREHFHDTRHLSPKARALYAGVKRTKEGLQVLTHSQDAARESLMKHMGLYEKDNEQKSEPLRELLAALGTRSALPVVPKPSEGDA